MTKWQSAEINLINDTWVVGRVRHTDNPALVQVRIGFCQFEISKWRIRQEASND